MNKTLKIISIVLASIIALAGIVLLVYYCFDNNSEFYTSTTAEFEIPGLDTEFVPQGITYDETHGAFLVSGYMDDGTASRIYVIYDGDTTYTNYFTVTNNGVDYIGHSGGIATNGTTIWIAADNGVYRLSSSVLDTVSDGGSVEIIDSIVLHNRGSYVIVEGDYLWMGEYYRDGYATSDSHKMTTPSGDYHGAVCYCYEIDDNSDYGLASTTPVKALSTTAQVQGMVISGNTVVLSTSYSMPKSKIYTYNIDLTADVSTTIEVEDTDIPLYIMDSQYLVDTFVTPSMSEEMVLVDGRVHILYENACKKYWWTQREHLTNVYSYQL